MKKNQPIANHPGAGVFLHCFLIGGALGLGYGIIYILLPTVTGALTGTPIQLLAIPFAETTAKTSMFLPAVASGLCWDIGIVITGMVLPFFAVVGSFVGLLCTMIANPMMYHSGILSSWMPGDDTIATNFHNYLDFYFSFGIGISLAVAIIGIFQLVRSLRAKKREKQANANAAGMLDAPKGRGDIKTSVIIACYFLVTVTYILVSGYLINWHKGVMIVLFFFGFLYTPLISYVTARLEGMAGQVVEIPMIKEASLIMSGYQGVSVWFLPIPISNYGAMTVFYRQCELTGTRFTSIWKTTLILTPIILVSSLFFMNFIWGMAPVPSAVYPFANKMWELNANNQSIIFTSTMGEYSQFDEAFRLSYLAMGTGIGVLLFAIFNSLGAPGLPDLWDGTRAE